MGKKAKREKRDALNRRLLIYRTLWGTYSDIGCLPKRKLALVENLAEDPFIDFDRLARITEQEF